MASFVGSCVRLVLCRKHAILVSQPINTIRRVSGTKTTSHVLRNEEMFVSLPPLPSLSPKKNTGNSYIFPLLFLSYPPSFFPSFPIIPLFPSAFFLSFFFSLSFCSSPPFLSKLTYSYPTFFLILLPHPMSSSLVISTPLHPFPKSPSSSLHPPLPPLTSLPLPLPPPSPPPPPQPPRNDCEVEQLPTMTHNFPHARLMLLVTD